MPVLRLLFLSPLTVFLSTVAFAQTTPGALVFEPSAPVPGEEVAVVYEPPTWLSAGDGFVLRARLRTPDDLAYGRGADTRSITYLRRRADGAFAGSFVYPDSVAYALFAVSSGDDDAVDTNLRSGWPLLAHGTDGRPTKQAQDQEVQDLFDRDSPAAARAARARAVAFSDDPEGWSSLTFYEDFVSAPSDSATAARLALIESFDRRLALQDATDPDVAADLYHFASGTEASVAERWKNWLLANAPDHPTAVQFRVVDAVRGNRDDANALLTALDQLWDEVGPAHRMLTDYGFRTALGVDDFAAATEWADRRDRKQPWLRSATATALASTPATQAEGVRRLRAEVERVSGLPDDARPLFATVADHRTATSAAAARLQADLGMALLDTGDAQAAAAPLEAASSLWDTNLLQAIARTRLIVGDSLGAARALARAVALTRSDSLSGVGGSLAGDERWSALVFEAQRDRRSWLLLSATPTPLPSGISVLSADGTATDLASAFSDGEPTVVVLFSIYCGHCVRAMPGIEVLSESLAADGVEMVLVAAQSPSEVGTFFSEHDYGGAVYFDTSREAVLAFGSFGTPEYFVVDQEGTVRFRFSSLGEIPDQVAALRSEA